MKRIIPIFALATVAILAGSPLTTSATARPAVAPVADIQVTSETLLSNGKWRYTFSGSASYDPDGTITSYYWQPDGYCRTDGASSTTYYMDIPDGHYCSLVLTVTDNSNSTDDEVVVIIGGW